MLILTDSVAPPHGDLVAAIPFLTSHVSVQIFKD